MFEWNHRVYLKLMTNTVFGLALATSLVLSVSVVAEQPPVKKSKNGICHEIGSTYYSRTKNYTAYLTMAACLNSGGRRPKR